MRRLVFSTFGLSLFLPAIVQARQINTADIKVPAGYKIEQAIVDLAAPTMVAFDDQGRMLIAESGYDDGGEAKITRIEKDNSKTMLLRADQLGDDLPITAVSFYDNQVYAVHGGTVTAIAGDGSVKTVLSGIPHGDHQANQLVFKDGYAYLSVGTVTNSAVVGSDNAIFGWLKDPKRQKTHDVPCTDLELTGQVFESNNAIGDTGQKVKTGAYAAYGTSVTTSKGDTKCNGSVLKFRPDGSELSVVAWGLRNPYGLEVGPDKELYITMHGLDARGERPVENAWDCFYKVTPGAWYGWPDYACDVPVTDNRFKVSGKPDLQFLIKNHPNPKPPKPIAKFNPHSATNGFAFAPSNQWGAPTDIFIALFGDFTPATGTTDKPQGVKVIKINTLTGITADFVTNKVAGQASRHNAGGIEHPSDVTFGPDGSMYIADWGIARVSTDGLKLDKDSGIVWRVSLSANENSGPALVSPGLLSKVILTLLLIGSTLLVGQGNARAFSKHTVALQGITAGAVAGLSTILISIFALELPWHTPPRILATMVLGESAVASVLEFKLTPTLVGVLVLLAVAVILAFIFNWLVNAAGKLRILFASVLFGLSVWAVLQYFLFSYLFPLVVEKGFPPQWYAVTFGLLGLTLGITRIIKNNH